MSRLVCLWFQRDLGSACDGDREQVQLSVRRWLFWGRGPRRGDAPRPRVQSVLPYRARPAMSRSNRQKPPSSEVNPALTAGHETTTNLIGNLVQLLLAHPGQWQALRDDPGLSNGAIEEALRYDAPKQRDFRRAKRAHTFAGVEFAENAMVFQLIGPATLAGSRNLIALTSAARRTITSPSAAASCLATVTGRSASSFAVRGNSGLSHADLLGKHPVRHRGQLV